MFEEATPVASEKLLTVQGSSIETSPFLGAAVFVPFRTSRDRWRLGRDDDLASYSLEKPDLDVRRFRFC